MNESFFYSANREEKFLLLKCLQSTMILNSVVDILFIPIKTDVQTEAGEALSPHDVQLDEIALSPLNYNLSNEMSYFHNIN